MVIRPFKYIGILLIALSLFGACNTSKYLSENETFLKEDKITYKKPLDRDRKALIEDQLSRRIRLEPSSGFIWIPRHWFYYRDQELEKDNWYWRFIRNNIMREPSIIEEEILDRTTESMRQYLRTKGYFNASVSYSIDSGKVYSNIKYVVQPGKLFTIDSLSIESKDEELLTTLRRNRKDPPLQEGFPIDREAFNQEVNYLVNLARDHGYPQFNVNHIDILAVDTTGKKNVVKLNIFPPHNKEQHQKYTFGDLRIFPDARLKGDEKDTLINTRSYLLPLDSFTVDYQYLDDKITFRKGDLYSKSEFDRTLRGLSSFDIYRFPNKSSTLDTNLHEVNYEIRLKKVDRFATTEQFDVFYSDISNVNNQLLGLSGGLGFVDRNTMGGGEVFSFNTEGSFELGLNNSPTASANSYNFGVGLQLRLPRHIEYPIVYSIADLIWGGTPAYDKFKKEAQTRFSIDYQYTRRQSFFTYNSIIATTGYIHNPTENTRFEINHFGLNYWIPRIDEQFDNIGIGDNEFFRRRFSQRFITGLLFNDLSYEWYQPPNTFNESYRFIGDFELSGLEVMGIEQAVGWMGVKTPFEFSTAEGTISFSKFMRIELDGRYYRNLTPNQEIAIRVNAGLGQGFDRNGVPYIRQFYLGGPYSIRAWAVRALGPGNFQVDSAFRAQRLPFYQTGDFKFEANFEYRFHMAWILEGAWFLDIGNVWNLTDENPNYNLRGDSYKQLAVGSGLGFRFQLPYEVILRIDLGYPLHYPYSIRGSQWIFDQDFSDPDNSYFDPVQFNFAIGYPF